MSEKISRKVLSFIMEFIHKNGYEDLDGFANKLAHAYCRLLRRSHGSIAENDFFNATKNLKTTFFRINRVRKHDFIQALFKRLTRIDLAEYVTLSKFELARDCVSRYLEVGYDKTKFRKQRDLIIKKFGSLRNPHAKLIDAFEILLQKLARSFQVSLHGTKEYSGIDISKKIGEAIIGFQIKSVNDDISEDKIRSQTSKALEYNLDGFVWIYGRPLSKVVESSIQAAYHHFKRVNETKKMYCTLIPPELLAELFRRYEIDVEAGFIKGEVGWKNVK
jgi:hypothetical protein